MNPDGNAKYVRTLTNEPNKSVGMIDRENRSPLRSSSMYLSIGFLPLSISCAHAWTCEGSATVPVQCCHRAE